MSCFGRHEFIKVYYTYSYIALLLWLGIYIKFNQLDNGLDQMRSNRLLLKTVAGPIFARWTTDGCNMNLWFQTALYLVVHMDHNLLSNVFIGYLKNINKPLQQICNPWKLPPDCSLYPHCSCKGTMQKTSGIKFLLYCDK